MPIARSRSACGSGSVALARLFGQRFEEALFKFFTGDDVVPNLGDALRYERTTESHAPRFSIQVLGQHIDAFFDFIGRLECALPKSPAVFAPQVDFIIVYRIPHVLQIFAIAFDGLLASSPFQPVA